jgi:hypothetical protein
MKSPSLSRKQTVVLVFLQATGVNDSHGKKSIRTVFLLASGGARTVPARLAWAVERPVFLRCIKENRWR